MSVYVLDTNIISFYLKGNEVVINNFTRVLANGDSILVAPIAYYEIKRGLLAVDSQKRLKIFEDFCKLFGVGLLDNKVLDVAANIYAEQRRIGRMMEDADILIAAFCKYWTFPLVTNNTKHFSYVSDLTLFDWTQTN
ncbi:MAG: type II toxin-antitoxin system VapC family toxin [Bacteroidales bacterium]|nr:type II toxin-antitoxin system VapC family toxin [Bacteroidales bacterium]